MSPNLKHISFFIFVAGYNFFVPNIDTAENALRNTVSEQNQTNYVVYQSIALDPKESGIVGMLQILQDQSITPEYRKEWGISNGYQDVPHGLAPNKGRFRFIGANKQTIFDEELDAPLGKIKKVFYMGQNSLPI